MWKFLVFLNILINSFSEASQQCGGKHWTGSGTCQRGLHCYEKNIWYSACKIECPEMWICQDISTTFPIITTTPSTLSTTISFSNMWIGDLDFLSTWVISDSYGDKYREIIDDPKGGHEKVLQIRYPKGSYAGIPGIGTGFYVYPFDKEVQFMVASFEFDLLFTKDFDWVKGGKLPGLFGGRSKCTGGDDASDCYSARFMWGRNGNGYPYLYLPKDAPHLPEFCELTNYKDCNRKWGFDFNESSFFVTDKWMHVKQHIELNKINEPNGKLQVWVDDELKDDFDKIIWRIDDQVFTLGFQIESFFGGSSDSSWATPVEQFSYFKGFKFTVY